MAKEIENLNINGESYEIGKIYAKMGLTYERFVELLERDFYCPTLTDEPTSSTLTYTDTDGSVNQFQIGQFARWLDKNAYRLAVCTNATETFTEWYIMPDMSGLASKSELENKQDVISDLDIIRTGANKGSTALRGSETSDELDDVETDVYIKYVTQTLSEEQKVQARENIGAASTEELQRMYNELLVLIQGGVITPSYAILDQAILDQVILS